MEYYTVLHSHENTANTSKQLNGNYNMYFALFLIAYRMSNTEFVNIKLSQHIDKCNSSILGVIQLIKRQSCLHIESSQ